MTFPTATDDPYNVFSPVARADHALLARMREQDPVYATTVPGWGTRHWFLTRYDDCNNFLRDPRFGRDLHNRLPDDLLAHWPKPPESEQLLERHLLGVDPPDHTRMRGLVHKAFTPRAIKHLQDRAQEVADAIIDEVAADGEMDLIEQYAFVIPITMITEMLGVPTADRNQFRSWIQKLFLGRATEQERMMAGMAFMQYMNERIAERRAEPREDILSGLVHASEDGDTLSHQELLSMIFLLLTAGYETTVHLIGTGVYLLLTHEAQRRAFQDGMDGDPALVSAAIEEMVRYGGPATSCIMRWAWEDVEIGGHQIRHGDAVTAFLHAANRDPAVFPDPDRFDISRTPNRHLGFGAGVHYCLGAPLARMEGSIALPTLLRRLPELRLAAPAGQLSWRTQGLYGLQALPVRF